MDQQSRSGRAKHFLLEEHPRFAGKFVDKSMYSALQRCILKTCDRNGKRLINRQPPISKLNRGWQGYEVERVLWLRYGMRSKKKSRTGDQSDSHFSKSVHASRMQAFSPIHRSG